LKSYIEKLKHNNYYKQIEMHTKELIKTISAKALFKFIAICCIAFYIPVAIIMAFLALAGIVPSNLNGQEFTGLVGFIIPVLTSPIFILILTIAHWIVLAIGLVITRFWFSMREKKVRESTSS